MIYFFLICILVALASESRVNRETQVSYIFIHSFYSAINSIEKELVSRNDKFNYRDIWSQSAARNITWAALEPYIIRVWPFQRMDAILRPI